MILWERVSNKDMWKVLLLFLQICRQCFLVQGALPFYTHMAHIHPHLIAIAEANLATLFFFFFWQDFWK